MGRKLTFEIFRYNPADPKSKPHMQSYELKRRQAMTLFIALNKICEEQDPPLQFDFCCRAGICGSCGMVINGKPGPACHTPDSRFAGQDHSPPASGIQAYRGSFGGHGHMVPQYWQKDRILDSYKTKNLMKTPRKNAWTTPLGTRFRTWPLRECGCCVAACGTARACAKILWALLHAKPLWPVLILIRAITAPCRFYEVIGDDQELFSAAWACWPAITSVPNSIPLQDQLGIMRRMATLESVKRHHSGISAQEAYAAAKAWSHNRALHGSLAYQVFITHGAVHGPRCSCPYDPALAFCLGESKIMSVSFGIGGIL